MERVIYARQGDLVIDKYEGTPDLKLTNNPTVIAGSHKGAHTLPAGVEYAREGREHFVRPRVDCELVHASRHVSTLLRGGQLYRIWPQIERHGDGDQDVED